MSASSPSVSPAVLPSLDAPVPGPAGGRHGGAVVWFTGLSGAGKSTALRVFEDLRYFTVDGLPAGLAVEMVVSFRLTPLVPAL